jgi:hypothetical protein
MFLQPSFTAEIEELIGRHPRVRGIAAGHTHTNERPTIADRPVHICPSLTLNFDIEEWTTLPPGYRTYEFRDDGTVNTTLHLHDDERWPRLPVPEPAIQYIQGQLSWEEMQTKLGIDLSH